MSLWQRYGTGPTAHISATAWCIFQKIHQHRRWARVLKQREYFAQHTCLEFRFVRRAERSTKLKRHPEKPGWPQTLSIVADEAYPNRRQTFFF